MEFLTELNSLIWGGWMIVLLLISGTYLTFKTGFIQFLKFKYMVKNTVLRKHKKQNGTVSPFQAMSTALAGTIGTGSIAGIATAITLGGPGTVFWMWVSGILGMATKYSEILLAVHYREKNSEGNYIGGPMFYIEKAVKKRWLSVIFCVFAICATFGMGNTVQSNAISGVLYESIGISPWITGTALCIILTAVVFGGIGVISKVNEKLVPFMALVYIGFGILVLCVNAGKIPDAFLLIFRNAFSPRAIAGGALQYGFSRGIFSNEAGLGSAPMAHGSANAVHPSEQGLWGMFEVFFTTGIICTMTALVILTCGLWQDSSLNGAVLSANAFKNATGSIGGIGVNTATVLFALSSVLGWAYYGEVCVEYLSYKSKKAVSCYRVIYVLFVFVGAVAELNLVWSVSELINAFMAVPNIIAVILLGNRVREITQNYFKK